MFTETIRSLAYLKSRNPTEYWPHASWRENPKLDYWGVYTNWGHQSLLNRETKGPNLLFTEFTFTKLWRINEESRGQGEKCVTTASRNITVKLTPFIIFYINACLPHILTKCRLKLVWFLFNITSFKYFFKEE